MDVDHHRDFSRGGLGRKIEETFYREARTLPEHLLRGSCHPGGRHSLGLLKAFTRQIERGGHIDRGL
jgi:hypothetical protein